MKDRMERLVVLPFSLGCTSHASIDVVEHPSRGSSASYTKSSSRSREGLEEEVLSRESTKHSVKVLVLPKTNISSGVNKLVKSFKSLSQLFTDEMKDLEMEMEIGCPTDVKHVTHIGWDGTSHNITEPIMGWDKLITPELLSQSHPDAPALSPLTQFELSSAAAAGNASPLRFTRMTFQSSA